MKIALLREGKIPADKRVALSPKQCLEVLKQYPGLVLVVQPSPIRKFTDQDYLDLGIILQEDLSDCDVLIGVKEVPNKDLIPHKTYFYFSHTIKEQPYNKSLLLKMLSLNIRMIDYEVLTNEKSKRLIGFGRYAGIVGCYNGFLAYGKRTSSFSLKPAHLCEDRKEMEIELRKIQLEPIKIILTGSGRVGNGILELINIIGIRQVSPNEFLNKSFDEPVFVHLNTLDYNKRIDGSASSKSDFYTNPGSYQSDFLKFAKTAEMFVAGHYYAAGSPFLFTRENAKSKEFKIRTVADVSCDINGPVACTIQPSTIQNPIYGYNPFTELIDDYAKPDVIAVMAVDNLPCELPKDSSIDFGAELIKHILPCLLSTDPHKVIERATICENGKLTEQFSYLESYVMDS
ncbi:NAD(P)-dependent oxidoreductase [Flavobacteriales bacterium]|jgi:saccharopine dehydrogenase (NAD+, L-lysine-forming)|nr:NAD(P)-dependent oxidoreductase [Flavobacteriales bacterium]